MGSLSDLIVSRCRRRVGTVAGLAAPVFPLAVFVHLGSEAVALGGQGDLGFLARHAYLLVLLVLAAWSFCSTVGIGAPRRELIRRCALLRGLVRRSWLSYGLTYAAVALAIVALTQALEGFPIVSGAWLLGSLVAIIGSIFGSVALLLLAPRLSAAVLSFLYTARMPIQRRPLAPMVVALVRAAANAFALCAPKRPPPMPVLSFSLFLMKQGHHRAFSSRCRS